MRTLSTPLSLQTANDQERGIRIIANSLFRELLSHGYSPSHVINLTSELLELLTASMRGAGDKASDLVTTPHKHLRETA